MHQLHLAPNLMAKRTKLKNQGMAAINVFIHRQAASIQIRFRIIPTKIAHVVVFVGEIKVKIFADTK